MRWVKRVSVIIIILSVIYFLGPHPSSPAYSLVMPSVPSVNGLEQFIAAKEALHKLRLDNEARIVWANDSVLQKTEYSCSEVA